LKKKIKGLKKCPLCGEAPWLGGVPEAMYTHWWAVCCKIYDFFGDDDEQEAVAFVNKKLEERKRNRELLKIIENDFQFIECGKVKNFRGVSLTLEDRRDDDEVKNWGMNF